MTDSYTPPFTITPKILTLVETIGEAIGRLEITTDLDAKPQLRRKNRIRTVQGSLSIEGNTLNLDQVSAIFKQDIYQSIDIFSRRSNMDYLLVGRD